MSVLQKLLHDLENDPKVAKDVALGKRVRLYRIREQLGTGNFSKVKLGIHLLTKEKVAVKIIDRTSLDDRARKVLSREILCMEKLLHPNLIRLYEVVESIQKVHIIMEYAPGGELNHRISSDGPFVELDAKNIFIQIANAIQYMHDQSVIHRDLKAENVIFSSQNVVKVGDFGFSTISPQSQLLDTFCGSPPYAAPELFKDDQYYGPPVDIWAMGVLLVFIVTGKFPFCASTVIELKELVLKTDYELPGSFSPEMCDFVKCVLTHNPTERASISELFSSSWLSQHECGHSYKCAVVDRSGQDILDSVHSRLAELNVHTDDGDALKDCHCITGGIYNIVLHQIENLQMSEECSVKSSTAVESIEQQTKTSTSGRRNQRRHRSKFCSIS